MHTICAGKAVEKPTENPNSAPAGADTEKPHESPKKSIIKIERICARGQKFSVRLMLKETAQKSATTHIISKGSKTRRLNMDFSESTAFSNTKKERKAIAHSMTKSRKSKAKRPSDNT